MVMKGVEHDLDGVVVEDILAPRKPGANLLGLVVEAHENGVKILVVVSQVHLGPLRNWSAIARHSLPEALHHPQFALPCGRRPHCQEVFEFRRTGDARNVDRSKFGGLSKKRGGKKKTSGGAHQQQQERSVTCSR